MENALLVAALVALFYLLGKAADVVILNIRIIAEKIGIRVFFLGIILGMLTSLPEFAIGLNALSNNIESATFGNLIGGTIVLFCFVLGLSILLNRQVKTDGKIENIFPIVAYLFLPLPLALDGTITLPEGVLLVALYFILVYLMYLNHPNGRKKRVVQASQEHILQSSFLILAALAAIVLLSNLIVRITLHLLVDYDISPFTVGLIVFAFGTNLPEIIVTIRSWKRHIRDLALSNILGSAIANSFLIGIFAIIKTLPVNVDRSFFFLAAFFFVLFVALFAFYRSQRRFVLREGLVLLGLYGLFLASQIVLNVSSPTLP